MDTQNSSFFNQVFKTQNQQIHLPVLEEKKVTLHIKREDEIHPFVSGNKFRKLKYNILEAKNQHQKTLLTFGGAFSNHIIATAVAANLNGFKSIGIIRGDELANNFVNTLANNATLKEAHKNGMTFEFVTRAQYRKKMSSAFMGQLKEKFGAFYLIPEGGTNDLAIKGCAEILTEEDVKFDYICAAVGTGGTIAGLVNASTEHQNVLGFPALKGNFLEEEIQKWIVLGKNWHLKTDYHFGGYAKYNDELIRFINTFFNETGILLDPIYTGKMLFGILEMVKENKFAEHSKILAIHTGGIQGITGINNQLKRKNKETIQIL